MRKGGHQTEETKLKISEAVKGENHPFYGKHHTKESMEKMSKCKIGKNNPFYGRYHTEEEKEKIRKGNMGKVLSEETKLKMSIAKKGKPTWNKGKKCPQLTGENNSFYGKTHTKETKLKISKIRKKLGLAKGINNPMYGRLGENASNWRGGISFEPYSPEFNRQLKELIRQRDGYKCQLCGMPECENISKFTIHHIDYVKKNCLPSNLTSLCRGCNTKVNYNRDYWEEYFKEKILEKAV